ncbi:MAG: hypothetical protein HRU20_18060 [Pseudomonadales bacterium]|nr:hypothetical protein [Pseudomonadales bacterium]
MATISLDGTKMKAHASKHNPLSYKHVCEFEKQLKPEVETLLKMANNTPFPDDFSIADVPMNGINISSSNMRKN